MSNLIQSKLSLYFADNTPSSKPLWNLPHSVVNKGIYHKLKVVEIPFMGFYDSIWSYIWEDEFDQEDEFDEGDEFNSDMVDWKLYYTKLAIEIVDWIRHKSELLLSFEKLTSPREYNFESDRIFAYISETQLELIYREVDKAKLGEIFKGALTERSGFIPYYSVDSWQAPVLEWDYALTALLMGLYLSELLGEDWERECYGDLSEAARNLLWECKQ